MARALIILTVRYCLGPYCLVYGLDSLLFKPLLIVLHMLNVVVPIVTVLFPVTGTALQT